MGIWGVMDIEIALKEIDKWHEGEYYSIQGIVNEPDKCCDQSPDWRPEDAPSFKAVAGYQHSVGFDGDGFEGCVYFQLPSSKWVATRFQA